MLLPHSNMMQVNTPKSKNDFPTPEKGNIQGAHECSIIVANSIASDHVEAV